ncbi:MAG TPA: pyridoxamine 5'-phosphate oxidase family protein [Xanthobacteraceae bacterium]
MRRSTMAAGSSKFITSMDQLMALYEAPSDVSIAKEIDYVSDHYRAFIEAAPFCALATCGPEGLDCSPRGDAPGFVRVADRKTLLLPDRRGNNRIDSLRNIMRDPRVALLFLIPGIGETIRVVGSAALSIDPELLAGFVVNGKTPSCVIVVTVEAVFYQCTKAIVRSKLWDPAGHVDRKMLPTAGAILAGLTAGRLGGAEHDRGQAERTLAKLY